MHMTKQQARGARLQQLSSRAVSAQEVLLCVTLLLQLPPPAHPFTPPAEEPIDADRYYGTEDEGCEYDTSDREFIAEDQPATQLGGGSSGDECTPRGVPPQTWVCSLTGPQRGHLQTGVPAHLPAWPACLLNPCPPYVPFSALPESAAASPNVPPATALCTSAYNHVCHPLAPSVLCSGVVAPAGASRDYKNRVFGDAAYDYSSLSEIEGYKSDDYAARFGRLFKESIK